MDFFISTCTTNDTPPMKIFVGSSSDSTVYNEVFPSTQYSLFMWSDSLEFDQSNFQNKIKTNIINFMLASEQVLRKDWDLPEEDEAWENL